MTKSVSSFGFPVSGFEFTIKYIISVEKELMFIKSITSGGVEKGAEQVVGAVTGKFGGSSEEVRSKVGRNVGRKELFGSSYLLRCGLNGCF